MFPRLLSALAVLVLAVGVAGCAPSPSPAPSPTGFASEEEAFAAAEETYRAYVDALNRVDLSDPATFEDVYAWTTGDANAEFRRNFSRWHADGWRVTGASAVDLVNPIGGSANLPSLAVCLDVSDVVLVDTTGASMASDDRPNVQSMRVDLVPDVDSSTGLKINEFSGRDGEPACG